MTNVRPIAGEKGRFLVQSRSRSEVVHVVDLAFVPDDRHKPVPWCSCEDCSLKDGKVCWHIIQCVRFEQKRLSL